jgi:hypothetical protein
MHSLAISERAASRIVVGNGDTVLIEVSTTEDKAILDRVSTSVVACKCIAIK